MTDFLVSIQPLQGALFVASILDLAGIMFSLRAFLNILQRTNSEIRKIMICEFKIFSISQVIFNLLYSINKNQNCK